MEVFPPCDRDIRKAVSDGEAPDDGETTLASSNFRAASSATAFAVDTRTSRRPSGVTKRSEIDALLVTVRSDGPERPGPSAVTVRLTVASVTTLRLPVRREFTSNRRTTPETRIGTAPAPR